MKSAPREIKEGDVFGRLTVITAGKLSIADKPAAMCQCECGNVKIISRASLIKGASKSCGCLRSSTARAEHARAMLDKPAPPPGVRLVELTDTRHNAHDGIGGIGSGIVRPGGYSSLAYGWPA